MELTERKKKVLRSIVDLYIRTAEPVGSKAIAALPGREELLATLVGCLVSPVSSLVAVLDEIAEKKAA